ncbi:uncharacterized protein PS065_014533 [Dugong dugon]
MRSKATRTFEEKGDQRGSYEGRRKMASFKIQGGSQRRPAISRQSEVAKEARHKRQRSPDGSPDSHHKRNGEREDEGKGPSPPAQARRVHTSESSRADRDCRRGEQVPGMSRCCSPGVRAWREPLTLGARADALRGWEEGIGLGTASDDSQEAAARGAREEELAGAWGSADTTQLARDTQTKPRPRGRSTGLERREESRKSRRNSPKRHRHLSPKARAPVPGRLSGLFAHMGALDVALDELRAPGGAFLPVPAGGTQPGAAQRAWLTWQLAHAGAALHWAFATLDAALAAQFQPTGPPPSGSALGGAASEPGTHLFQGPSAI